MIFQETNVTDEYLSEGIEGFTEIFETGLLSSLWVHTLNSGT